MPQKGKQQSESRSPQTGHSTLGQRASFQSLLWQAVSPSPLPLPQQSIHQSELQRALELVMCARQLSVCGNLRQTKGESRSRPSWHCTASKASTSSAGRPEGLTPVPACTHPDVSQVPSKAFSAAVSILGDRLQNNVTQWLTTMEGKENMEYIQPLWAEVTSTISSSSRSHYNVASVQTDTLSGLLYLTCSMPNPSSSMVPSHVMWSLVSRVCELKRKDCFPVIHGSLFSSKQRV